MLLRAVGRHPLCAGCTLNTTGVPPAIMLMVLLLMVSVGLVVGVMEQITPKGCVLFQHQARVTALGFGGQAFGAGVC